MTNGEDPVTSANNCGRAGSDDDVLIEVCNLSVRIDTTPILHEISFTVRRGERLAIIGSNGAGKSTLLKSLNRLLPSPLGCVRIDGRPAEAYRQRELARILGYVPQFRDASSPFTVRDFMLMSRYPYLSPFSPPSRADHDAVDNALDAVGMTAFAHRRMPTLSGGECQKVLIAAALAQETPVLLLDEPTSFLDPRYQADINRLLHTLKRQRETTVVAVSHDINSAALGADRILALKQGRIVFWDKAENVMTAQTLHDIFDTTFVFAPHPHSGTPMIVPEQGTL